MPARVVRQNREIKELFRKKIREKIEREIEGLSSQRYTKWFCFARDGYKGKVVLKKSPSHNLKMKRICLYDEDQWGSHFLLD